MAKLTNAEFERLSILIRVHGSVVGQWTMAMRRRPWWNFGKRTADEEKMVLEHNAIVQEIVNFAESLKGQNS